jgi:hypothetical protein
MTKGVLWNLMLLFIAQFGFYGYLGLRKKLTHRHHRLHDYTDKFLTMCHQLRHNASFVVMIIGGKGGGKTAQMFKFIHVFLRNLSIEDTGIVFYNAPDSFMDALEDHMPPDIYAHTHSVRKMRKITEIRKQYKYMILCYDEAQRDANAKQSLSKKAIRNEKMVAIARHLKTFLIINSQNLNVSKNLRTSTEFRFYKGNTGPLIDESNNKFLKTHKRFIENLYAERNISRSAFEATYKKFQNDRKTGVIAKGFIDLELFDWVPYWHDAISKGYQNANFDADYDEFLKDQEDIERAAKMFLTNYPHLSKGDIGVSEIRGILRRLDQDLYYDVQDHFRDVKDEIKAELFLRKMREKSRKSQVQTAHDPQPAPEAQEIYQTGQSPGEFLYDHYRSQNRITAAKIINHVLIARNDQVTAAQHMNISVGTFSKKYKDLRVKELGYLIEEWAAQAYDLVIMGGNKNVLDAFTKQGQLVSIKSRYGRMYSQLKYKKTGNTKKDRDFAPANELANYFDVNFGILHFYPPWGEGAELKTLLVDPFPLRGPNHFIISKDDPSHSFGELEVVPDLAEIITEQGVEAAKQFILQAHQKAAQAVSDTK